MSISAMSDYSVSNSLVEEAFWPDMLKCIHSTWQSERIQIRQFCKDREIKWLCHFTTATNLKSIFDHGIQSRKMLIDQAIPHQRVDGSIKLYFDSFNYLSVSSPNTKMLYRKFTLEKVWVAVVVLDASLLWSVPFFSIPMNSARREMPRLISQDFTKFLGLSGLRSLFSNRQLRELCNIPVSEPTDIQSEVILLESIPRSYIKHVLLTPIDKTSKLFLTVANDFGFFQSGTKFKYEWKWLSPEVIKAWDPKYSVEAQTNYNLRNWKEDWGTHD